MKRVVKWLHKWWDVSRATYLAPVLLPVILAGLIAYLHGYFAWSKFVLILLGVSFLGLGCYIINDYFDYRSGVDERKERYLSWSGLNKVIYRQSNPIIDGRVTTRNVLWGALGFFACSVPIGIYLTLQMGYPVLVFGIVGFLIAYLYSAPPFDLSSHGLGEIFPGIAYGPLAMMGTYYTLTGRLALEPLIASMPVGLYVSLVRWIDAIPGYRAHKDVGETKLTVLLGPKRAGLGVPVLYGFIYMSILIGILAQIMPLALGMVFLSLPLAIKITRLAVKFADDPTSYMPAIPSVLQGYAVTLLLMMAGYALDGFVLSLGSR